MGKTSKIILILCIVLYAVIFITYLSFESPKPNAQVSLSKYFSSEKINAGKKYFNERVMLSLTAFFLKIGFLFLLYKLKIWNNVYLFFTKRIKNNFLRSFIYTFTLSFFLFGILLFPLNLFSYFHLKSYKIIITPFWLYIKDFLMGAAIFSFGAAIIAAIGIWIYRIRERLFPLFASIFVLVFAFFMMIIYPVFITPLFNDFSRLKNPELEKKITEMLNKRGIKVKNLFVVNASVRTLGANAYVAGLGPTKEIVLYDTLIKDYNNDEILSILAHELGHYEKNHVIIGILAMPLSNPFAILAFFIFLSYIVKRVRQKNPDTVYHVPLILLIVIIAFQISMPLTNAISRRMERDADFHSLVVTKNSAAFISSQVKISSKHYYSNYDPNVFYKMLYYTHPPVKERIGMALAMPDKMID